MASGQCTLRAFLSAVSDEENFAPPELPKSLVPDSKLIFLSEKIEIEYPEKAETDRNSCRQRSCMEVEVFEETSSASFGAVLEKFADNDKA